MDENLKKKSGFLLRWPKPFRRRPPHVTDQGDAEIADIFRRAHLDAEAQDQNRIRRVRKRLAIGMTIVLCLTLLSLVYIARLQEQLAAPDHAIKTHEAQQRIIYGPQYEGLKSRHPDQPVIPPMEQWKPQGDNHGNDQVQRVR